MKKKIVMKVQMNCLKCRSKAMQIASSASGVDSVAIEGSDKDRVVVIGDGVDPISLVSLLRKKVGRTEVISVEEVKDKKPPEPPKKPSQEQSQEPSQWIYSHHHPRELLAYELVYEPVNEPHPRSCCMM